MLCRPSIICLRSLRKDSSSGSITWNCPVMLASSLRSCKTLPINNIIYSSIHVNSFQTFEVSIVVKLCIDLYARIPGLVNCYNTKVQLMSSPPYAILQAKIRPSGNCFQAALDASKKFACVIFVAQVAPTHRQIKICCRSTRQTSSSKNAAPNRAVGVHPPPAGNMRTPMGFYWSPSP